MIITLSNVFAGICLVLIACCLRVLARAFCTPLRNVPGPWLARFTRFWKLREIYRGSFEKTNVELHRRYGQNVRTGLEDYPADKWHKGPIVRIGPQEYSIDNQEAAKVIYGHGKPFIKSPWYYASGNVDPHKYDLFTDRDSQRHAANRRKVANFYSMTALLKMEPFVDECNQILFGRFDQFAETKEVINVTQWMQFYAADVIGQITLSKRFGFLEKGEDIGGILAAIDAYLQYGAHVGVYSELHPLITALMTPLMPKDQGFGYMAKFTQDQIDTAMRDPKRADMDGQDFLSKCLAAHRENPEKFTTHDVFSVCITNIGAGSDTTSISLSSVLWHLYRNPQALKTLRQEISDTIAAGGMENSISFAQAQKMPYLQAVLKEALRMHPATGLPLGRVVPQGGATLAGRYFPASTVVGVNSWVAHANTDVFGADAAEFRPERWLEKKDGDVMQQYFFTFGQGSRTCIGKNISLMEMSKLIAPLVHRYDFDITVEGDLTSRNIWFVKPTNFNARIVRRTQF